MLNISHFRLREPAIYSPQSSQSAVRQGQSPLCKPSQSPPRFQDTRADMQWIGSMPTNTTATRVSSTGQSFTERLLNALSPLRP